MYDDMHEVPEVGWPFFTSNILPALPRPMELQDVVQRLEENGAIVEAGGGKKRWARLPQTTSPPSTNETENETYQCFENIIRAIREASGSRTRAQRLFHHNAVRAPSSGARLDNAKPGSYLLRNPANGLLGTAEPLWSDIMVPCEIGLQDFGWRKNTTFLKIIWSLERLLREDPTRRFVLAFTIERTELRVWFASRSDLFVSTPLDFSSDVQSVVDLFLRLQFAEDHELGIDETITRLGSLDPTGGTQYRIRVADRFYRTQRLVSSIGAESMHGKGTRVWEVRAEDAEGGEFGDSMVLKDSWGSKARTRERDIGIAIRNTVTSDPRITALLDKYLLHYVDSWDVTVKIRGEEKEDGTRGLMLRGMTPVWENVLTVKGDYEANECIVEKHPAQGTVSQSEENEYHVEHTEKIHHRVKIKEVGTTIAGVGTLSKAFAHLAEVAKALRVLHLAGWVHRDISVGNIIIHEGIPKLGDVEYARGECDSTTHDVRTGTAFFRAVEVHNGKYNVLRPETVPRRNCSTSVVLDAHTAVVSSTEDGQTADVSSGLWDEVPLRRPRKRERKPLSVDFKYNPLHDMESLLWLALYLLLCTVLDLRQSVDVSDEQWKRYQRAQDRLATRLFHDMNTRTSIVNSDTFTSMLYGLHPQVQAICEELDDVRCALSQAYSTCERDRSKLNFADILSVELESPWDSNEVMDLHRLFAAQFAYISHILEGENDIAFRAGTTATSSCTAYPEERGQ